MLRRGLLIRGVAPRRARATVNAHAGARRSPARRVTVNRSFSVHVPVRGALRRALRRAFRTVTVTVTVRADGQHARRTIRVR